MHRTQNVQQYIPYQWKQNIQLKGTGDIKQQAAYVSKITPKWSLAKETDAVSGAERCFYVKTTIENPNLTWNQMLW